MPNYPVSLDALANPTATTNRDDPGFVHSVQHATLNDIAEAVEAKVGIGATVAARGQALIGNGAGASIWDGTSRKNLLINGSMLVAQRAMPTADNAYCLDRWRMLLGAASACTPSQEVTDVPAGGSRRALKLAATATNNNKFGAFSPLEGADIWDLRGQTVSLSCWAKISNARIGDVRAAVLQNTGTEDSISATPITTWGNEGAGITTYAGSWAQANTPANLSVTTSWVRYYIEGISVSVNAANLGVLIWSDDKTTTNGDYLLITDVQLEKGSVCTDVERRRFQQELALCQRYYCKTFPYGTAPAQNVGSFAGCLTYRAPVAGVSNHGLQWQFPVPMRTTPGTITTYSPSAASSAWYNAAASAASGAASATAQGDRSVYITNAQAAGDTVGALMCLHATAEAEL